MEKVPLRTFGRLGLPLADPTRRLRLVVKMEGEAQDFMPIRPQKT